ncbi:hypothetical protein HIM_01888 [Hirsutella minnesotensis 3608]|nr:hypothetical protein HIM_01888 [Hirsutella minnesotensis 3608]
MLRLRWRSLAESLVLLAIFSICHAGRPRNLIENVIYHGAAVSPRTARSQGGIFPEPYSKAKPADLSLYSYLNESETGSLRASQYISTTTSLEAAFAQVASHVTADSSAIGYIYHLHPAANLIDVGESLGHIFEPSQAAKCELAALGGIRWNQVLGYSKVKGSDKRPVSELNYVANPDYDATYDRDTASGGQPQLAGFPEWHEALTKEPWKSLKSEGLSIETHAFEFIASLGAANRWKKHKSPLIASAYRVQHALSMVSHNASQVSQAFTEAHDAKNAEAAKGPAAVANTALKDTAKWTRQLAKIVDKHGWMNLEPFDKARS